MGIQQKAGAISVDSSSKASVHMSNDKVLTDKCGQDEADADDEEEMEEMFVEGPAGTEWNGPTRGLHHSIILTLIHSFSHSLVPSVNPLSLH